MSDEYIKVLREMRDSEFAFGDEQAALDAAIAALEGWRPIESAPNFFIGYERGDFGPVIYGVIRGPFGDFKLLADPEFEVEPTHWMPIPKQPAAPPTTADAKESV